MSVQVYQQIHRPPALSASVLGVTINIPLLADYIVDRHRTVLGLDLAGIAAEIGTLVQQDSAFGAQIGQLIDAQLTPVERGQLLSGRFGRDQPSPFVAPVLAKPSATLASDHRTADAVTRASDIAAIATPSDAPAHLRFAADISARFETLRQRSLPAGLSRTQGGTLIADPAGQLRLINEGGLGTSAAGFTPDLRPDDPARHRICGTFLTLPFDRAEGSYSGVAMGGGSAAYLINSGQMLLVAQSGPKQFALVRTQLSPTAIDGDQLLAAHDASLARFAEAGHSLPRASRLAAALSAHSLALAYYEGDGGILARR